MLKFFAFFNHSHIKTVNNSSSKFSKQSTKLHFFSLGISFKKILFEFLTPIILYTDNKWLGKFIKKLIHLYFSWQTCQFGKKFNNFSVWKCKNEQICQFDDKCILFLINFSRNWHIYLLFLTNFKIKSEQIC